VPKQKGFVARNTQGGWDVFCNSSKCIPAHLQKANAAKNRKELTADGELYFPYDPAALDLLRSFPPSKDRNKPTWDKVKKCRHVSLQPEDRRRVLELCERLGIEVAEELKVLPTDRFVESARQRCAAIPTLYPFQGPGVEFLASRRTAILADDMGLGKTVQTLLAIDPSQGALVVCPSAVKYSWADEIAKWRPDLRAEVMEGRGNFRFPKAGEVVITNFEILPKWLVPVKVAEDENGRDILSAIFPGLPSYRDVDTKNIVLVVDEAHRAKNYRTLLHKKIRELAALCGRTWFLTGTPLLTKPTDLYGVLQAGHMDRDVFGGWRGFVRCFNGSRSGWKGAYAWGAPLPEVPERMRRVMLRRLKEDVLQDLPSTVWRDITVDGMKAGLRKQLDALYAGVKGTLDRRELPAFEQLSAVRSLLSESRIPAMLDLVEDYEDAGNPLVVFSAYKAPIKKLAERDGWKTITGDVSAAERQQIVRDFQDGKLKGVGLTIAAGGVGLTLTAASNVLFVDLDWTPALNKQAVDRIRRIGQKAASVHVVRLVSNHPVDLRVHELLAEKIEMMEGALDRQVQYQPKAPSAVVIKQETQAELDARLAKQQAQDEQKARLRAQERAIAQGWLQREQNKASRPEAPITSQTATQIRDALHFMLNRCDGAHQRDDVGFNKPDAGRARILAQTGLTTRGELRIAERMLSRYHRQLHTRYPDLFV